jgi:acyl-CoA reductase-like NAD-dependent aldehyde dehydrogenase
VKMYVAGDWTSSAQTEEVRHPYDGTVVDVVPMAGPDQVDEALTAAELGAKRARALTGYERYQILMRAADLAEQRSEQLARTISAECGKTIAEARLEASRAAPIIRLAAFEGSQLYGHSLPLDAHPGAGKSRIGFTMKQPCGVVVAITPYNFPLLLVLHKVAPALAAGNAVVLKPARQTPLVALHLVEILLEAGIDPLAITCITGAGSTIGPLLCSDARVRKISFTGSTEVGESIAKTAGVKRLSLELGASCPVIIMDDADVEAAAAAIAVGGYSNAGQVCISVQRVLVDRAREDDLLGSLVPKVAAIKTGSPLSEQTTMGSLISEREAERVQAIVAESVAAGARLDHGGERQGTVMQPTVVSNVDPDSRLSQDELFGPVVAVTSVSDINEAVQLANATRYGLGAGIFTSDVDKAMRFVQEVDSGVVHVNWTPLWRADLMPYGGVKDSGIGKEGPRWAVEEMTETKTVVLHVSASGRPAAPPAPSPALSPQPTVAAGPAATTTDGKATDRTATDEQGSK